MNRHEIKPGDWVRFYQSGCLVIGEVRYVRKHITGWSGFEVSTDIGRVDSDNILEVRAQDKD